MPVHNNRFGNMALHLGLKGKYTFYRVYSKHYYNE
jgi:hypothetical protein